MEHGTCERSGALRGTVATLPHPQASSTGCRGGDCSDAPPPRKRVRRQCANTERTRGCAQTSNGGSHERASRPLSAPLSASGSTSHARPAGRTQGGCSACTARCLRLRQLISSFIATLSPALAFFPSPRHSPLSPPRPAAAAADSAAHLLMCCRQWLGRVTLGNSMERSTYIT